MEYEAILFLQCHDGDGKIYVTKTFREVKDAQDLMEKLGFWVSFVSGMGMFVLSLELKAV